MTRAVTRPVARPVSRVAVGIASGGGGLWTPTKLSNLVQWSLDGAKYRSSQLDSIEVLDSKESYGSYRAPRGQRCYQSDGVDDYGTKSSSVLDTSGSFTVCCWLYIPSYTTPGWAGLIGRATAFSYQSTFNGFCLGTNGGGSVDVGNLRLRLTLGDGTNIVNGITTTAPLINTLACYNGWAHVAGVVNRVDNTVKLYVDGVLKDSADISSVGTIDTTSNLVLGKDLRYIQAKTHDLRFYSAAKTSSELLSISADQASPDKTSLESGWWCNEESGTTSYDWYGNNDLALTNITESTFHAIDSGVTSNPANTLGNTNSSGVIVPRDESDTTKDATGAALQYTGQCPYPVVPKAPCVTFTGVEYLSVTGLTGSETIISSEGTSTPTVSAGKINFTAGTCCDLELSSGQHYIFQEGPGSSTTNRTIYNLAADSDHGTLVNGVVADLWAGRTNTTQDHSILYGGRIGFAGEFIPGKTDGSGTVDGGTLDLSPGKLGNPFTSLDFDHWTAPELSTLNPESAYEKGDARQAVAPVDTKFRRTAVDGDDRFFAVDAALTGQDKTDAESYVT